jgi:diketogulonate reductase-like aldo/keto reductase
MAEKYACQPSQIILSWAVQRGTSIVPKSRNLERILLNSQVVNLSEEDVRTIDTLRDETNAMRMNDPKAYIGFDIYNEEEEEPTQKQEMLKKTSSV